MAKAATRIKSPASSAAVPQSRDDCAAHIRRLGDVQRSNAAATGEMNDQIAEITHTHQPRIDALRAQAEQLLEGIHTWCKANRTALTDGGKVKTANLVTGDVAWRQRPPSVSVRGVDTVIDTLERLGMAQFVRLKKEVNKEAVLASPDEVRGVAGITVVCGVEDFVVTPFEQQA